MAWWKNLLNEDIDNDTRIGRELVDKYCLGIGRTFSSLTGREIEEIWKKEINKDAEYEKQAHLAGAVVDFKPNQKQFKQFDIALFKAYIEKFSPSDRVIAKVILESRIKEWEEKGI